jgi:hypothetical protein
VDRILDNQEPPQLFGWHVEFSGDKARVDRRRIRCRGVASFDATSAAAASVCGQPKARKRHSATRPASSRASKRTQAPRSSATASPRDNRSAPAGSVPAPGNFLNNSSTRGE